MGGSVAGEDEVSQQAVKITELPGLAGGPLLLLGGLHLSLVVREREASEELEDPLETSQREELLALVCSLELNRQSLQSDS